MLAKTPVLHDFDDNPSTNTRLVDNQLTVPWRTVNRVLSPNHRHAFHFHPVQFCRIMRKRINNEHNFIPKILWADYSLRNKKIPKCSRLGSWEFINDNFQCVFCKRVARIHWKLFVWSIYVFGKMEFNRIFPLS